MPYTNLSYLKDFTGDDPELIKDTIQRYLKNSPVLLNDLNQGLENEDWEKISFAAHTLFGATQIVGLAVIRDNLKKVESWAKERKGIEEIKNNIETINEAMQASYRELEPYK